MNTRCLSRPGPMAQARPCRLSAAARKPARLLAPGPVRAPTTTFLCASGVSHPSENMGASRGGFDPNMSVPNVVAAKGGGGGQNMGSSGSLGAVMERHKMEFVMPTPPAVTPKLDDGGSGGDIGKNIHNGGGGGDGDGGDDDDYFNEDGDGDGDGEGQGGDAFFRTLIPESYDKLSIGAVFAEWMRTVAELPLILRRAVEMGLFSSAQLVRFFSMDVRPNVARSVARTLPPAWARDFVGRLMADPAFVQKMIIESTIAAVSSLYYEYRARGERFKDELDLALINTMGMAAATAATVWMVAPTRSYGSVHKFPWQQMMDNLPNCVFDANGPLRTYTPQSRVAAFFSKAAELSAVGLAAGAGTSLLSTAAVALRRQYVDPAFEPSVPIPEFGRSGVGMAAFFAVSANTRYQLLGGMDRYLLGHSNYLWTYLAASGAARVVSNQVGESHRALCQGLPEPSSLPKRRVVKRKVMVRRKVLRPAAAAVEEPAGPGVVAAAAAAPLVLAPPEAHEAAEAGVSAQGGGEELVLDQVLSPAAQGPYSSEAVVVLRDGAHAAAPHALAPEPHDDVYARRQQQQDGADGERVGSSQQSESEQAVDVASLVAQQSSGALQLAPLQAGDERALAAAAGAVAASAGQLMAAGLVR